MPMYCLAYTYIYCYIFQGQYWNVLEQPLLHQDHLPRQLTRLLLREHHRKLQGHRLPPWRCIAAAEIITEVRRPSTSSFDVIWWLFWVWCGDTNKMLFRGPLILKAGPGDTNTDEKWVLYCSLLCKVLPTQLHWPPQTLRWVGLFYITIRTMM